uniref:Gag-pol polyprotein n=1 Tax=Torenia fournieri TaxID=68875 RepID=A0A0B6VLW1_9LAMI|nr:putative gag-pol polyprotein [Torenia fournieri]
MAARFEVEKFTGDNDFGLWKMKMRALLTQQGLIEVLMVEDPPATVVAGTAPTGQEDAAAAAVNAQAAAEKKILDSKAHSVIILSLGDRVLRQVSHESTALGLWKKLEELYMTKSLANRLYLKQALYSFKMIEEKAIDEQMDQFIKLILDLENIEVKIEDEDQALLLVCALPRSYNTFKDTLLYGRETLTLKEVQAALKSKQLNTRIDNKAVGSTSEALYVKGKGEEKKTHKERKNKSKKKVKCFYCDEEGHMCKNCPKKERDKGKKVEQGEAAMACESYESADVLAVTHEDQDVTKSEKSGKWLLDSASSFHVTCVKSWIKDFKGCDGCLVSVGEEKQYKILGFGTVKIRLKTGGVRILRNVKFIPDLGRNLISVGLLDVQGFKCVAGNGVMKVFKGSKVIMSGTLQKNRTYHVTGSETVVNWAGLGARKICCGDSGSERFVQGNSILCGDHDKAGFEQVTQGEITDQRAQSEGSDTLLSEVEQICVRVGRVLCPVSGKDLNYLRNGDIPEADCGGQLQGSNLQVTKEVGLIKFERLKNVISESCLVVDNCGASSFPGAAEDQTQFNLQNGSWFTAEVEENEANGQFYECSKSDDGSKLGTTVGK